MSDNQQNQFHSNYDGEKYSQNHGECIDHYFDSSGIPSSSSNSKQRKKGNVRKIIIPIICVLIIIAVVAGAFLVLKGTKKDENKETPANEVVPEQESLDAQTHLPLTQECIDVHTFEFYSQTKADETDLNACAEIMRERINAAGIDGAIEVQDKKFW